MSTSPSIIIIGAGLSGLVTAYRLYQANLPFRILEARERTGGRIHTVRDATGTPIEMGATWLGEKHTAINHLLKELGLDITEQYLGEHAIYEPLSTSPPQLVQLPVNEAPSYRIAGGSTRLIDKLRAALPDGSIHLAQPVRTIHYQNRRFELKTDHAIYHADWVVSTLPPRLLTETIAFEPKWPNQLSSVAAATHTWMGESIKVGFTYPAPFWRAEGLSGTLFSNVGPVGEMYDHSDDARGHFALKGFLNGTYHTLERAERRELVLTQLRKYYGNAADNFTTYTEKVWRAAPFTFHPYDRHVLPHQNNGHPLYAEALCAGRFLLGGAETAQQFPGYMDGAVSRGEEIAKTIIGTFAESP